MTETLVTLISSLSSAIVALIVAGFQHNKTASLMAYRLDQLEIKMDKYNNIKDRMAVAERDVKTAFNRIDELRSDIKDIDK